MADNVGYTPGVGATIAADDIGGILYQRVKMIHGANGIAHETADNNPLPVKVVDELVEAIEAMRMAIQSLNRTIGLSQTNATNGSLYVDGSRATQPVTGSLSTVSQVVLVGNMQQLGGQNANSFVPSFERMTADNLRRNINVT
jgi:hypothetical protein